MAEYNPDLPPVSLQEVIAASGKQLSTNDYTNEDAAKVAAIATVADLVAAGEVKNILGSGEVGVWDQATQDRIATLVALGWPTANIIVHYVASSGEVATLTGASTMPTVSVTPVISLPVPAAARTASTTAPAVSLRPAVSLATTEAVRTASTSAPTISLQPAVTLPTTSTASEGVTSASSVMPTVSLHPSVALPTASAVRTAETMANAVSVQPIITLPVVSSASEGSTTASTDMPALSLCPVVVLPTTSAVRAAASAGVVVSMQPVVSFPVTSASRTASTDAGAVSLRPVVVVPTALSVRTASTVAGTVSLRPVASLPVASAVNNEASIPATPATFTVSNSPAQITATFALVSGATSYKLYRSVNSDMSSPTVISGITASPYTIASGLTPDTTYYFQVSAVNASGESDLFTPAQSVVAAALTAPSAVTGFAAIPNVPEAGVSWNLVSGATSYEVFYSTAATLDAATYDGTNPYSTNNALYGQFTIAADATRKIIYSGLSGSTFYFRVRAVNAGGTGPLSAAISTTRVAAQAITPTNNFVTLDDGNLWTSGVASNFTWGSSSGEVGGGVSALIYGEDGSLDVGYVQNYVNVDGTFSFRAKASVAGVACVIKMDTVIKETFTLTTSWATYTHTGTYGLRTARIEAEGLPIYDTITVQIDSISCGAA